MIQMYHVDKRYDAGTFGIRDISLTVERGEFAFLTGSSGVPHPAVVECNDERFQSFTRRSIRYVRNPLRYEAGTEPITDPGKDLVGTTSDRYGLVGQYRPSKPHLMATARHPVTAPRLSDGSGQVREDRRPRHNGAVVASCETSLERVHRVVGMLGEVDCIDRP